MSRSDRFAALSRLSLSDLNRATSARYYACEMTGGHRPSGEVVRRTFPGRDLELPVCRLCGVPMGAPGQKRWGEQPI